MPKFPNGLSRNYVSMLDRQYQRGNPLLDIGIGDMTGLTKKVVIETQSVFTASSSLLLICLNKKIQHKFQIMTNDLFTYSRQT